MQASTATDTSTAHLLFLDVALFSVTTTSPYQRFIEFQNMTADTHLPVAPSRGTSYVHKVLRRVLGRRHHRNKSCASHDSGNHITTTAQDSDRSAHQLLHSLPCRRPYVYEALDPTAQAIRLLHVWRNERGVIKCDLIAFSLEHLPPYIALSYVWGAPTPRHRIFVNDGYFDVRQNLYDFLQEYWNEEQEHYIWIDQICINQCDTQERGHQVGIMAQVYSQAVYVVVWLGNNKRYQEVALKLLSDTAARDWQKAQYMETLIGDVYFTRLWVVQEFLLAKEVRFMLHGNVWLNWTATGKEKWVGLLSPTSLPRMSIDERSDWVFESYIAAFGSKECQNPLDRVYGLLGLVGRQICIIPDYEKSTKDLLNDVVNILATDYVKRGSQDTYSNRFADFREAVHTLGKGLGLDTAQLVPAIKMARDIHYLTQWYTELRILDYSATISLEVGFETVQAQHMDGACEKTKDVPADRWWLKFNEGSTRYYYDTD
jgi:hypothetical protein